MRQLGRRIRPTSSVRSVEVAGYRQAVPVATPSGVLIEAGIESQG